MCPWPPRTARAARAAGDRGALGLLLMRVEAQGGGSAGRLTYDYRLDGPVWADPTLLIVGLGLGAIAMALWAARGRAAVGAALVLLPAVIGAGAAAVVVKRTAGRITGDEARAAARDTTKSALRAGWERLPATGRRRLGRGRRTAWSTSATHRLVGASHRSTCSVSAAGASLQGRRCERPIACCPALRRRTEQRLLAGVAGGVADWLNAPVGFVRVVLVLLGAFSTIPVAVYAGAALLIPARGHNRPSWDNLIGAGSVGLLFLVPAVVFGGSST